MTTTTNILPRFKLHIPAVKPGDFGPSGFAVWCHSSTEMLHDGDIIEADGDIVTCNEGSYDEEYMVSYRQVRTLAGYVGTVIWSDFDGRIGFEAL